MSNTRTSRSGVSSAPLLIGCDLTKLDDFTLGLLTNDEVLAVDQDALGRQATRVAQNGGQEVWAKPLADGAWAVGLFNRDDQPAEVALDLAKLKLAGPQPIRDLWRKKNLPAAARLSAQIPAHGGGTLSGRHVGQAFSLTELPIAIASS